MQVIDQFTGKENRKLKNEIVINVVLCFRYEYRRNSGKYTKTIKQHRMWDCKSQCSSIVFAIKESSNEG